MGALAIAGVCLAASGALTPAQAAPAAPERYSFAISAPSTSDALIALAIQSRISIGGGGGCEGRQTRLQGRFTVAEGLNRLLAGSACHAEFVDARTVKISPLPPARTPAQSVAAAIHAPPPAPQPEGSSRVEELRVAAIKRPGFGGEFPGALEVFPQRQMTDSGVIDTEGVARQSTSFITTNLGPARNKILLRGLSDGAFTGRTQSTVGTYLDGVPVTYNAPDPDLRLADVERVEILRGPQGTLYGGGALSGVYRIVTAKPKFDETSAEVSGLMAATQGGAPTSEVSAIYNTVLAPGEAAGRVVIYDDREGGYLQNTSARLSNVDLTKRTGGRAAVRWLIGNHWTGTLSSAVQVLGSSDTQYVTTSVVRNQRSNQVRETHNNNFADVALNLSGDGAWGRLESTTSVVRHRYASRYDASNVLMAFGADPNDEVGIYDEASAVRMFVHDTYWSSPESGPLHLMAGVFGSSRREHIPSALRSRTASGVLRNLYQEERSDSVLALAAYGEASYDMGDGWTASAGARLFRNSVQTQSTVDVATPNQDRLTDRQRTFAGVSPRFTVQKTWAGGSFVYLLASTGYRAGGFNTGGLLAPARGRDTFAPDQLQNYEIGGVFESPGGRLSLRSALFYDHWNNIQTDQYLASGLSYTANVGDGRNIGLEVEAGYQLTQHLKLKANALLDRPEVTSLNVGFSSVVGARLPGVPSGAFTGGLAWTGTIRPGLEFLGTVEASYTGKSHLTFDPRFSPVTPAHYTGVLSAQLVWPKRRCGLFISNPLNTADDTFAYGNPFSFGQVRQVTPQRPRTVSLSLSRRF